MEPGVPRLDYSKEVKVGTIKLSDNMNLIVNTIPDNNDSALVWIDARKFLVSSDKSKYSGPTKQGLLLTKSQWESLIDMIRASLFREK